MDEDIEYDEHAMHFITFEVLVKVYLRHREEPILAPTKLQLPRGGLIQTPDDVSTFCIDVIQADLDSKGVVTLVLGDNRADKRLFFVSEIQHIVVLAPETLPEELTNE